MITSITEQKQQLYHYCYYSVICNIALALLMRWSTADCSHVDNVSMAASNDQTILNGIEGIVI